MITSLLLGLVFFLWLYWLWTRRNLYRFSFNNPGYIGLPLLGSLLRIKHMDYIIPEFGKMFSEMKRNSFCLWLGTTLFLLTRDPDLIGKMFSSPDLLNKGKTTYNPILNLFKGGLIASPAERWKHNRKLINPSFNNRVLEGFFPVFHKAKNETVRELEKLVDGKEHHNMLHKFCQTTIAITLETSMGLKADEHQIKAAEFSEKIAFVMDRLANQILLSFVKLSGLFFFYKKFNNYRDSLYEMANQAIMEKLKTESNQEASNIKTIGKNKETGVDIKKEPIIFIDRAFQLYKKQQFTLQDIISETYTIFVASFETTATGIYSTLLMLAMHSKVQERLFDEIISVFPEKDFELKFEDLEKLPYFDMVIDETLRIIPSVPLIARLAINDTRLTEELTLPKNLEIWISIFHLHRCTDFWGPDANKFNPDNFLPENVAERHPYAYMPFSRGVRNCIGWKYALIAMKIMVAGIIRNYRISTSFKYENLKFKENIALRFIEEPPLQFHHRY